MMTKSLLMIVAAALAFAAAQGKTTFYVDCNAGSDANNGTSEAFAWKSVARVNDFAAAELRAGDAVLFRRGCTWRESLVPASGDADDGDVVYGAFGDAALDKPTMSPAYEASAVSDWLPVAGAENVWEAGRVQSWGENFMPNPSFDNATLAKWYLYSNSAKCNATMELDMFDFDTAPASLAVTFWRVADDAGNSDVQLYTRPVPITTEQYELSFRAKASSGGLIKGAGIGLATAPWTGFATVSKSEFNVTTEWSSFSVVFWGNTNATDARLTLRLGNGFEAGTVLHLDSFALKRSSGFLKEVGIVVFDNSHAGALKWERSQLSKQDDFHYSDGSVFLFSSANPATLYSDIELGRTQHIISQGGKHHVTYENLALRYTGAHGIGGGTTDHITVRSCDFSFIGGGRQGGTTTTRFGNGVEFWCNATNSVVERCRFKDIYDAALTNQCTPSAAVQRNITYRYNTIVNAEYCFEYWNRGAITDNVSFVNNVCSHSGYGFGHDQRPNPTGYHLCFFWNSALTTDLHIHNNIFSVARRASIMRWTYRNNFSGYILDNNLYHEPASHFMVVQELNHWLNTSESFQNYTDGDWNSLFVDPELVDEAGLDFHLTEASPAIDAGLDLGPAIDMDGNAVPNGAAVDIGAFEYYAPVSSDHGLDDSSDISMATALSTFIAGVVAVFATLC